MNIKSKATVTYTLTYEEGLVLRKAIDILELLADGYKLKVPKYDGINNNIMKVSTGEVFNLNDLIVGLSSVCDANNTDTTISEEA